MQYEMYVDKYARQRNRAPSYEPRTFYGQLLHIYLIKLQNPVAIQIQKPKINIPADHCIVLVAIGTCEVTTTDERLDLHYYSRLKTTPDIFDATALQCVVGRVPDGSKGGYGVVDRSGTLARALYLDDLQQLCRWY
ncbi:hypothetical protein B0H14DRAFT_2390735 [Mycena olivaceomarginata]|nr:hypothetical protein B0H14DRAFT_2390735 [Mycena olivaceomarginata]